MTVLPSDASGPKPQGIESVEIPRFFQWRSLVTKLTLLVGLTLAALIAVLVATGFYFGRGVLREEIEGRLSSVAASRQAMVMAHLSQLKQRAELLADHGEFRGLFQNLRAGRPDTANRQYSQNRLDNLIDHRTIISAMLADWSANPAAFTKIMIQM